MTLPKQPYAWLMSEPGPRMLGQMLALFGTHEYAGAANNPVILAWAEECGIHWLHGRCRGLVRPHNGHSGQTGGLGL
jgi:hypothetical protein